ncbi:hypothetical protein Taro_053171 [Colocasia esculenta]|uniref:AB hydrolase-1 domain-containing protein n=1 Tax=Colocasia esculenta TaxID=4460 RepID=A0A843XLE7_COLES|nr:hypothetical protein [Colocasia esculenta]
MSLQALCPSLSLSLLVCRDLRREIRMWTAMADLLTAFPIRTFPPPRHRRRVSPLLRRSHGRSVGALEENVRELRLAYKLKPGQSRLFHRLPSGASMEVIYQKSTGVVDGPERTADSSSSRPPLVFVHGSFHAAWCWAEHWLPFFSGAGFDCYAVSLIGQGESDLPKGNATCTLQTHTRDIADFIQKEVKLPPVLVGHSFGGLIVQSYISHLRADCSTNHATSLVTSGSEQMLAGAVLVCSVPPSGNSGLVWRYLLTKPVAAIKVTLSLAAKAFANSLPLCKETFFSLTMEDQVVQRYQELMKQSSRVPIFDLRKLNSSLPVPSVPHDFTKVLVLGAGSDFIVDGEGLRETARFYGVEPVCLERVAHDVMLDCSWEKGAEVILSWLKDMNRQRTS